MRHGGRASSSWCWSCAGIRRGTGTEREREREREGARWACNRALALVLSRTFDARGRRRRRRGCCAQCPSVRERVGVCAVRACVRMGSCDDERRQAADATRAPGARKLFRSNSSSSGISISVKPAGQPARPGRQQSSQASVAPVGHH